MGLQKYRADYSENNKDGSIVWYAKWLGGPTLSKIENCRIQDTDMRRMVYITGEPDTFWTIPAACKINGKPVRGYVTNDDDLNLVFVVRE